MLYVSIGDSDAFCVQTYIFGVWGQTRMPDFTLKNYDFAPKCPFWRILNRLYHIIFFMSKTSFFFVGRKSAKP